MRKAKKIERLSPELEAALPSYRDQWRVNALRTDGIDEARAREAVVALYRASGLAPPRLTLIAQSPMQALMMLGVLRIGDKHQLWDHLGDQLRDQLWDHLGDQLGDQLRDHLWDQLRDHLWDQLGDQLWDHLGDQLRDQLWDQIKNGELYQDVLFGGGADGFWLAFYDFGRKAGAKYQNGLDERLNAYITYARECGLAFLYADVAIISDRPSKLKFDEQRRLHSEAGPAIEFRDGWSVSAWRGVRIPDGWTSGKPPSASEALTWRNMEQRRAACEIVGWENILMTLNASTVDRDKSPQIGELVEVDIPDIGRERFLRVVCGTGRKFALPVPPDMKTALQANAWTWGLRPEEYAPEIRT